MGLLPVFSFDHQTSTVLEHRLHEEIGYSDGANTRLQDYKTTSNRKRLLAASRPTPIGSTRRAPYDKINNARAELKEDYKAISNRKRLLAASGATPIGSTTVPPMTKTVKT